MVCWCSVLPTNVSHGCVRVRAFFQGHNDLGLFLCDVFFVGGFRLLHAWFQIMLGLLRYVIQSPVFVDATCVLLFIETIRSMAFFLISLPPKRCLEEEL